MCRKAFRAQWSKGLFWIGLALVLFGCRRSQAPNKTELSVFAAASLTETFSEMSRQFEAEHPGVRIVFSFAGSQQLAYQLGQGAPADVFASADSRQMEVAITAGRVSVSESRVFAYNRLVIVFPEDNPAGLSTLADLGQPGLRLILGAEAVPAGRYALDFLERAADDPAYGPSFEAAVLDNVVSFEENVRAVLSKVILGEADAGIVYASDVEDQTSNVGTLEIPGPLNVEAAYLISPVADSQHPQAAAEFVDYVLSTAGQNALKAQGLKTLDE